MSPLGGSSMGSPSRVISPPTRSNSPRHCNSSIEAGAFFGAGLFHAATSVWHGFAADPLCMIITAATMQAVEPTIRPRPPTLPAGFFFACSLGGPRDSREGPAAIPSNPGIFIRLSSRPASPFGFAAASGFAATAGFGLAAATGAGDFAAAGFVFAGDAGKTAWRRLRLHRRRSSRRRFHRPRPPPTAAIPRPLPR